MGAEIEWLQDASRVGVIRFGSEFQTASNRDPWEGCAIIKDHGDWCYIGTVSGKFTKQDWFDITKRCIESGFKKIRVERHKNHYEYDLTVTPIKKRKI